MKQPTPLIGENVPSMSYPPNTLYYLNQKCDKYSLSRVATKVELSSGA